jgi:SAM-dependent methyltransferase
MQVSRTFLERDVLPLFRLCNNGIELEASLTRPLSRSQFTLLLQHLLHSEEFKLVPSVDGSADTEQLDVSATDIRVTIVGKHNVSAFCTKGSLDASIKGVTAMRKHRIAQPLLVPGYPIKIRANKENLLKDVGDLEDALSSINGVSKTFRYKKRYSLVSANKMFRVDMTVVRQGHGMTFLASGVSRTPETFEAEVEYIGGWGDKSKSDSELTTIAAELLGHCGLFIGVVDVAERPLSSAEVKRVLAEYTTLVGAATKKNGSPSFVGPQPVTLERRNLVPPTTGIVSVLDGNYTITDKADGTRSLLLVSQTDGECYLINAKLEVTAPGLKLSAEEWGGTLVDGEFVTHTRLGAGQTVYAAFDIYWLQGRDVRMLPLIKIQAETDGDTSRLGNLHRFITSAPTRQTNKNSSVRLYQKRFYWGTGSQLLGYCKDVLASGNLHSQARTDALPYEIDGVIFTPRSLPVGASTEQDKPRDGTWQLAFKWKPQKFNSIDFKVEVDPQELMIKDGIPHKVLRLLVGALMDTSSSGSIDPVMFLTQGRPSKGRAKVGKDVGGRGAYVLKPFLPPDAPSDDVWIAYVPADDQGRLRCDSGELIENGAVVEFGYSNDENIPAPYRWRAMRLREDKPKPNFQTIAFANWRSIMRPVTEQQLCGIDTVSNQEIDVVNDSLYYVRPYSRDTSATKPMLHFHNHWVKGRSLLSRVVGGVKGKALFDIACGKGGDLPRWIDAGLTRVSGVDVTEDNIVNATDGIYARMSNLRLPHGSRYAFVTADGRNVINASYIASMKPGPMRDMAHSLWNIGAGGPPQMIKYRGMCAAPFDIVTCHFAIHYFFESAQTLKALVANVAAHLAPGGYFVGTCFDAQRVHRLLEGIKVGDDVSAEKAGRNIWSIKRMYDNYNTSFGRQIAVFIETIGRYNTEYLVDFEALKAELELQGIVQPTTEECQALSLSSSAPTGTFDELWQDMVAETAVGTVTNIASRFIDAGEGGALAMSEQEKQLSFLNRWFVFRKKMDRPLKQRAKVGKS